MSIAPIPGSMTEQELDEQWIQQMQNQLVQCGRQPFGSEAPAELWLRPRGRGLYRAAPKTAPDAVRYVRADQEPLGELGADHPR